MIYADTSALAKLVVAEAETPALRSWFASQSSGLVTNSVGVVELQRLAARVSPDAERTALLLLSRIDRISLTAAALALAGQLPPPELRTLDALHVASAAELVDLVALLTYDRRMAEAASHLGLPVESPRKPGQ
ncbi:MAG: type II toxin-antitoxin system VapC family toxin [Propionibacteriaceae bacterium]|nr:type II toxin-antitoxin system VapC family toxin [Propionibacteriaceae bacterium]